MGGSSLAPEVICGAAGVELDVLDSSDPDFVRTAIDNDLAHTVVVVSSKSGGTVETDSQRRAYEKAFTDAGIDPRERIVVVTDPGSPLDQSATEAGYRVFRADPTVGGRFSALTAFGLVPSGLAGADIGALLAEAEAIRGDLEKDSVDNPGLRLGALMGVANLAGVDKLVLCNAEAPVRRLRRLGRAADRRVDRQGRQGRAAGDRRVAEGAELLPQHPRRGARQLRPGLAVRRRPHQVGLGRQRRRPARRPAAAVGARHRRVRRDHRHQPLRPARRRERQDRGPRRCSTAAAPSPRPSSPTGRSRSTPRPAWLSDDVSTVHDAIVALLAPLDPEHGYVAVQAYLDRHRDAALADVRATIAAATDRPVTFGWGPRFLHSTGQYHKGGPPTGVYLQITSQPERDLAVPDRPFTFHEFLIAQAVGDGQVLAEKGRPVLRLHLDSPAHLDAVRQALQ